MLFIAAVVAAGVFVIYFAKNSPKLKAIGNAGLGSEKNQPAEIPLPQYTKPEPEVSLIAVGDIMLSRAVEQSLVQKNDFKLPFEPLADYLSSADITFGNLETAVLAGRVILTGEFLFRTDPKAVAGLTLAGFDVLSLANNHAPNFGQSGLKNTFAELEKAGIKYAGAGLDEASAAKPVIIEKQGMKFGFLAYTYNKNMPAEYFASANRPGTNPLDSAKMKTAVINLRPQVDWLIVSIHDGTEYQFTPDESQTTFARAAIDAGADLIIGSHPHVVQTAEKYKNGYIFYSLGNFVFDQVWSEETQQGLLAKIIFTKDKIKTIEAGPIKINASFQPEIALGNVAQTIISRLQYPFTNQIKFSWDKKSFIESPGWQINLLKPQNYNSIYQVADLDGDSRPEEAVVVDRAGYLIKDGQAVWKTDEGWQVDNVLIGDFNNDGISEVGLSLWKEGSYGASMPFWVKENDKQIANHLFLYQFENNTLKNIWGSSALDQPIKEMALGDFDQDGKNELAVIETGAIHESPVRGLGLWRFSGFNFFNIFKSRTGNFSGLKVFGNDIYLKEN